MTTQTVGAGIVPQWTFADRMRKARQQVDMIQADFARALGVTPSAYSQWEMGSNKPRDLVAIAQKVAAITGVSAAWLLGIDEGPTNGPGLHLLPQEESNLQHFDYRFRRSGLARRIAASFPTAA